MERSADHSRGARTSVHALLLMLAAARALTAVVRTEQRALEPVPPYNVSRDQLAAIDDLFGAPPARGARAVERSPDRSLERARPARVRAAQSLERVEVTEPLRGTAVVRKPKDEFDHDAPYFTCERDCASVLPALEVAAPPADPTEPMPALLADLGVERGIGPRVPCAPNWSVWRGVGEEGCTLEKFHGADCGPGSPFELALLWTCARSCVQKFHVEQRCEDDEKGTGCAPTWLLADYDDDVTCERRCDACKPKVEDPEPAEGEGTRFGLSPAAETCIRGRDVHESHVPMWMPLAHRGPRRPASKRARADFRDALLKAAEEMASDPPPTQPRRSKSALVYAVEARLNVAEPDEAEDGGPEKLSTELMHRIDELDVGSEAGVDLPKGWVSAPPAGYCACECTRHVAKPTECINAWAQARGLPSALPMTSDECRAKAWGGHMLVSPVPEEIPEAVIAPAPSPPSLPVTTDWVEEIPTAEVAAVSVRSRNRAFKSEQMDEAHIPSLEEAPAKLAKTEEWEEWRDKLADLEEKHGRTFHALAHTIFEMLDPKLGIVPASGDDEQRNVRPLSAIEACWCAGTVAQPQGFDWSDYYRQYYAQLRSCEATTCAACRVTVGEFWRQFDRLYPEAGCRHLTATYPELVPRGLCVPMVEQLDAEGAGIRQLFGTALAKVLRAEIEAAEKDDSGGGGGMETEEELDRTTPEDEQATAEKISKLLADSAHRSCVRLGCCQQAPV